MKYKHLMVDLETMSNKGNAAIVSIIHQHLIKPVNDDI